MKARVFVGIAGLLMAPVLVRAADPFLGTWVLDVKRSTYATGPVPKEMTIEMKDGEHGVHYHSETVWLSGSRASADYTADYDGPPVIVMGAKGMLLQIQVRRIKPNEVSATYTRGMHTVAASRRVVSEDGRSMTVTTTSWDESGSVFTNVGVYTRVEQEAREGRRSEVGAQASGAGPVRR